MARPFGIATCNGLGDPVVGAGPLARGFGGYGAIAAALRLLKRGCCPHSLLPPAHIRHQRIRLSRRPRAVMPSILPCSWSGRTAPLLPTVAGSRTTGGIYSGSSAGRGVSSVVRAAVARCWCLVVLLPLASCRAGGAPLHRAWRVARRSARPVWLGGSRR